MAKLGSSGGSATMQRSKLSVGQTIKESSAKLDDGMGGGGIGKGIFNGGGGDGGDDDDDDDFADGEGDDEGDGEGFFRRVFQELYDARAIAAVLQEWYRTVNDLPLILRQAAQMGLFSSAALVRFMAMDVRPGVTRFVTRALPAAAGREVVGRLMADPAFAQKLLLEQAITLSATLAYEGRARGDRFWRELDLVAANVLALQAANAAAVYLVAPTRAAPAPGRHAWQNQLARLPNNVFEGTTPLRAVSNGQRAAALAVKAAELCGVGMAAGAAQAAAGRALLALRRRADPAFEPAVPVPTVRRSALGLAATLGVFANARYQVIAGFDRYLFEHAAQIWSYLALSGALRAASTHVGDQTRVYLQGLPAAAAAARGAAGGAAARARAAAHARLVAQYRAAAAAAGVEGAAAGAGPKRRRKRVRRSAGFEMGVGPAPAAA
jgi:hypothetical protein